MVVTKSDGTTKIHLSEISSVIFCTTQVYVSAYLMSELAKAKIPVVFSDEKFLPVAESLPMRSAYNTSAHVADQIAWSEPAKKRLWQKVVQDKIALQARVLELNGHPGDAEVLRRYSEDVRSGDPDNREAVAAARYFQSLFGAPFNRDLDCPLNYSLDYGYTIMLSKVAREIAARGYMTQIGIHHRSELNPWNLASDLMEPFRPYIDIVIVRTDMNRFDSSTRRGLIDIMSDTVIFDGGNYKLGNVVAQYVEGCLAVLNKQMKIGDLKCYELA